MQKPIKNITTFAKTLQRIHMAMTLGLFLFMGFAWVERT
jgi:hypothetical protein